MRGLGKRWKVWTLVGGAAAWLVALLFRLICPGKYKDWASRHDQYMKHAPPFIEIGGDMCYRLPYLLDDCTFITFWAHGNEEAIRSYCKRTFAAASNLDKTCYEPMGDLIIVALLDTDTVRSQDEQDCHKGILREREVSIVFPLAVRNPDGSSRLRMVLHMPHLWVDANPVMTAGREVLGFQKCMGDIIVDGIHSPHPMNKKKIPSSIVVQAEYMSEHTEQCRVRTGDVCRILAGDSPLDEKSNLQSTEYEKILAVLKKELGDPESEIEMFSEPPTKEDSVTERFTHAVFLKQFRDIRESGKPCYQAVAEAPLHFQPRPGSPWIMEAGYEIQIPLHASLSEIRALFVGDERTPDDGSPAYLAIPSYRQVGMEFDLTVLAGATVGQSFPRSPKSSLPRP